MPATVYIETTIIGHLTTRVPRSPSAAEKIRETHRWWKESRQHFDLFSSEVVRFEIARGDPEAAAERLKLFTDLPLLSVPESATDLAERLVRDHALPAKSLTDATHLAIAAVSEMDYLLTWNCKHLANATLRDRIERTCHAAGFDSPIICTPLELEVIP